MKTLLIVLDSFGIGALPDAEVYGDQGSNTIKSAVQYGGAELKNMRNMGLFNIDGVECGTPVSRPCAAYGRAGGAVARKGYNHRALGTDGSSTGQAFSNFS